MKLLNRTTYTYLLFTIPIVLISMVMFFFLIRYYNLKHVESNLIEEHSKIVDKSKKIKTYFIEDELSDELFVYEIPMDSIIEDRLSTVMVYDSIEGEEEPHRQLETMQIIAGKKYKIIAQKSLVENSSLIYSIGIAMFFLIMIIAATFILLNRLFSAKTWRPFHHILDTLMLHQAGKKYNYEEELKIKEFDSLNRVVQSMVERINKQFFIHKEFIDIVSHEYQTPLAVIRNEAELLIQNQNLDKEEMEKLGRIIEYVGKLSRLNRSLLLLSRIDNNQYDEREEINVKQFLATTIEDKRAQLEAKNIDLKVASNNDLVVYENPTLISLLIGNLLQNAIRHNLDTAGVIIIEIRNNRFHIYNSGQNEQLDKKLIFKKFNKNSKSNKSIGLGLSLIKSICDYCKFGIDYIYESETSEHHFIIDFNKSPS